MAVMIAIVVMVIMIVVMGVLGTPKKTGCLNKRRNYGFSTGD